MTEAEVNADAPVPGPSAGDMLRTAREAAGMSVDTVAQQLKLAPRQVRAIEDGDFTQLPGRTFVRGFIRNYARLVRVDPEAVLAALPAGAAAPSLDSPALQPTAPTIGELPTTEDARPGWTRWAIPLTLVAIIAATAFYEWTYPNADTRGSAARESSPSRERAVSKAQAPEIVGTPLPNPVAALPAPPSPAPMRGSTPPVAAPANATPATVASKPPAESLPDAPPSAPVPLAPPAATPSASAVAINSDAPLTLQFRDFSWTEVRDRNGRVLISRMNPGGTTQSIAGAPPFDVVIGNAADVALTWKGHSVDLAPHTRQNVARFTLE